MSSQSSQHARVVIVGGGIAGCSVAYHLAKLGWRDIVLLEQGELAGGTTWHAAGMVGRLRTSSSMAKINESSARLYANLASETGVATGWKQVGSLIVARTAARMTQLRRTTAMAEYLGIECHIISSEEAQEKWPLIRIDDLLGAAWIPGDGKVHPKQTALSLAEGARRRDVQIRQNERVLEILHARRRIIGVRTAAQTIYAEYIVLCGGMWTRELALECGVSIPLYPVEHHYVVSNSIDGAFDELPCGRDPDGTIYFRGEGNAVLLGAFQAYTKAWLVDRIPADFSNRLLSEDWEQFAAPLAEGEHRIPKLRPAGYQRFVNGPESFTPDNNFLLGECPEMDGLYVAAGFNSAGIACAGGAGEALAQWMVDGEPPMDLWSVDIRRFSPLQNNRAYLRERVTEVLGLHYRMAWPNLEMESGRGIRRSPVHDQLASRGACFGAKMAYERPLWFARGGVSPKMEYSFERQNWFDCQAAEHRAARENLALFDQSSFGKILVQGPDALRFVQRLCGNNIDVPIGRVVYTGLFNTRGTFESDLTVVRAAEEQFYLVTSTGQIVHDLHWLRKNRLPEERLELVDVTSAFAVLSLMGPNSRKLLQSVTDADVSSSSFRFGWSKQINVGMATARALRITYVGELGYELHVGTEQASAMLDALLDAGKAFDLTLAGHYAINSLRLEKGYRAYGSELSTDETPFQAGLEFAIDWNKPFLGSDVLYRQRETPANKLLLSFVLHDSKPLLWGAERIFRDGKCVGYTTSGAFGHALGSSVALGFVKQGEPIVAQDLLQSAFEIEVDGRRSPTRALLRAPYDPERKKIHS